MKRTESLFEEVLTELCTTSQGLKQVTAWARKARQGLNEYDYEDIRQDAYIVLMEKGNELLHQIEEEHGGIKTKLDRILFKSRFYAYAKGVVKISALSTYRKGYAGIARDSESIFSTMRDSVQERALLRIEEYSEMTSKLITNSDRYDNVLKMGIVELLLQGYEVKHIAKHANKPKKTIYRYMKGIANILAKPVLLPDVKPSAKQGKRESMQIAEDFTRVIAPRHYYPIFDNTSHALHLLHVTNTYKTYEHSHARGYYNSCPIS